MRQQVKGQVQSAEEWEEGPVGGKTNHCLVSQKKD